MPRSRPARVVPLTDGIARHALEECNRAIESAPDHAEFYRSRTFIRASRGETRGLVEDLQRFELLGQSFEESFYRNVNVRGMGDHRRAGVPDPTHRPRSGFRGGACSRGPEPLTAEPQDVDHDDLDARVALAETICRAGTGLLEDRTIGRRIPRSRSQTATESDARAIAAAELDKVLAVNPGHIVARMIRMMDLAGRRPGPGGRGRPGAGAQSSGAGELPVRRPQSDSGSFTSAPSDSPGMA